MQSIRLEHITKVFGRTRANEDVSMDIRQGEVLSILGENGSGKTTLLNVLGGIYQPDEGKIYIDDKEVHIRSPKDSYAYGIGMVHQHYKLVEAFTAVENVVLGLNRKQLLEIYHNFGIENKGRLFSSCSLKQSAWAIANMCSRYGFAFEPNKKVIDMSIAEKQTLEIIKTLFRGVDTLILDEPTAVLTPQEIRHLFDVIRNMKSRGKTVVIITHKLNEVMEISDRIVVLRKGHFIGSVDTKDTNESALADWMVGKKVDLDIHRSTIPTTGDRLVIKHLNVKDADGRRAVQDASFVVKGSEILGIVGVSGSGQKELLCAIAGLAREANGEIIFHNPKHHRPVTFFHKNLKQIKQLSIEGKFHLKDGSPCNLNGIKDKDIVKMVKNEEILFYDDEIIPLLGLQPLEIRNLGIKLSFVPEDRLGMGMVRHMSVVDNMLLRSYRKGKGRMLDMMRPRDLAKKIVDEFDVKTPSLDTEVGLLSGGNIQKLLVGRELFSNPKILMVAYPVRGLDINTSYLIYNLLDEEKKKGTAVIYVGEDLDTMLALTDRIVVLCDGKITGIVDSRTTSKEEVGLLMSSGAKEGAA